MYLLIINPGSTSTKISVFQDEVSLFEESAFHDAPQLMQYPNVNDQIPLRKQYILEVLERHGMKPSDIDVFVGRGGSKHPAKLGVLIAYQLCKEYGGKMYTMDPTNIDELSDVARVTGIAGVYRNAQTHALNQRGVALKHAKTIGKRYSDCNFVVSHIDGGITVSAHDHGRIVDGNVGAGGDGSFTPTRIGSVPVLALLKYIEEHSLEEVRLMCSCSGGFVSWFGTSDAKKVHALVESGDPKAVLIWNAMIYQIAKSIGAMSAVLRGKVDGILLTGGLCRYADIIEGIREYCGWIAPITVYPGEVEQEAMAHGVLRVLRGEENAHTYAGKPVWSGFSFENK